MEKAKITDTVTGETTPVMFNPEQYTLAKGITYAETAIPGLSSPILQWPLTAHQGLWSAGDTFPNTGSCSNFFVDVRFDT